MRVLVSEMVILWLRVGRSLLVVVVLSLFVLLVDGYRGIVVVERVLRRHPS